MKTHLNVERYGDGEHRVYMGIPGFGAPHEKSFGHMLELLPEAFRFYGIDPPGLGKSPQPHEWTWDGIHDHMVDALEHVVEREQRAITLVGACSGSFHAMEMARRRPELVDELVLIEPFSYFPWFVRLFVAPGLGYGLFRSTFGSHVGRKSIQTGLTLAGLTGGFDTMSSFARVRARDLHTYLSLYRDAERRGPLVYADLKMPKRLYYGTRTFRAVLESVPLWGGMWPDIELITIEDVGHQVTQEDPEQIVEKFFHRDLELIR